MTKRIWGKRRVESEICEPDTKEAAGEDHR